MLYPAQLITQF